MKTVTMRTSLKAQECQHKQDNRNATRVLECLQEWCYKQDNRTVNNIRIKRRNEYITSNEELMERKVKYENNILLTSKEKHDVTAISICTTGKRTVSKNHL